MMFLILKVTMSCVCFFGGRAFNIKNTITWGLRLVEAPPFGGFRLLYATQLTINIKHTMTWGLRLVEAPPFWGFRLLYATHRDL